jgi:hypothetical protein
MNISELKEKVIFSIQQENNEALLEDIYTLMHPDDVYILSNEQKSVIAEAQEQYRAGAYKTDSEAQTHFDKWRKK